MKVHGFHWVDKVTVGIGQNGAYAVVAINNRDAGLLWTFSVGIDLHALDEAVRMSRRLFRFEPPGQATLTGQAQLSYPHIEKPRAREVKADHE